MNFHQLPVKVHDTPGGAVGARYMFSPVKIHTRFEKLIMITSLTLS